MAFAKIRGRNLFYISEGKGFPVLLGHSYLFDHTMWQQQIDALSTQYRVIATDLWGHGRSDPLPPESTSLEDFAFDHLTLMEQLDIKEFAVIGLSVGGMWGAELAILAPQRIKSLILMDSFLGPESTESFLQYQYMLTTIDNQGAVNSPLLEYVAAQFYSDDVDPADLAELKKSLTHLNADQLHNSIIPIGKLIFGRPDRLNCLTQITTPSLVITGEKDKPRPPKEGDQMAKLLNCKHIIIPNAGHISCKEQPERVTKILLSFLEQTL